MKLLYVAPFLENSGYGEAARGYAKALHKVGVELTLKNIDYDGAVKAKLTKEDEALFRSLFGRKVAYDRVLAHCVPEHWYQFLEKDKKAFGYTVWETSVTPPQWTQFMNGPVERILVPSKHTIEAVKTAGVRKNVVAVPHTIDVELFDKSSPSMSLQGVKDDDFIFLASSQFTERKNFVGLLRAYYHGFHNVNNAVLILKTYLQNNSPEDQNRLLGIIDGLKKAMNMPHYPRVVVLNTSLSNDQMVSLHRLSHANVLLHRGEGWGLSLMEAALAGKPVITTAYGGVTDFLDEKTAYLVNYTMTPVFNMWGWYQGAQMWAEPDLKDAITKMRSVFMLRGKAAKVGAAAREHIKTNFNYDVVGQKMKEALE